MEKTSPEPRMIIRITFAGPDGKSLREELPFEDAIRELLADPYFPHREHVIRRHLRSGGTASTRAARYEMSREDVAEIRGRQAEWLSKTLASFTRPAGGRAHLTASGRRARRL
jgi:hypothetical protein